MTTLKRQTKSANSENLAGDLAQAAFSCFSQHGFKAVSLDQIAVQAGVTKGAIYWHYNNKHDLTVAACQHYYQRWFRQTRRVLAPLTDPWERLEAVLSASVRSCVMDRKNRVFTAEIFAMLLHDDVVRMGWAQFYDSVREVYAGLLDAVVYARQLKCSDVVSSVDLMLATMEGIKQRAAFDPSVCDPREQERMVANLLALLTERRAPTQESRKKD